MVPNDYPKEFEEDFISLDTFRNHRYKTVFPDPKVEEILRSRAKIDFIHCLLAGVAVFLLLLWMIPTS